MHEQRQQERANELRIRHPCFVAWPPPLEREYVDENGLRPAKKRVVWAGVLEAEAGFQQILGEVERQRTSRLQHLRGPLIWKAREWHPLVLEQQAGARVI